MQLGIVLHELLHSLGIHHMHTRANRDEHVRVIVGNIDVDRFNNFVKRTTSIDE